MHLPERLHATNAPHPHMGRWTKKRLSPTDFSLAGELDHSEISDILAGTLVHVNTGVVTYACRTPAHEVPVEARELLVERFDELGTLAYRIASRSGTISHQASAQMQDEIAQALKNHVPFPTRFRKGIQRAAYSFFGLSVPSSSPLLHIPAHRAVLAVAERFGDDVTATYHDMPAQKPHSIVSLRAHHGMGEIDVHTSSITLRYDRDLESAQSYLLERLGVL